MNTCQDKQGENCTQTPRETVSGCAWLPCGYVITSGFLIYGSMVNIVSAFGRQFYPECQK